MALLSFAIFVSASAIGAAYGGKQEDFTPTTTARALTRDAMDSRFEAYIAATPDRREVWSDLVKEQVDAGRMTAAYGFLLAAPAMLNEQDARSLQASVHAQDLAGDEALAQAALQYLREDVRNAYDRSSSPLAAVWRATVNTGEDAPSNGEGEANTAPNTISIDGAEDDTANVNALGDTRDLALQASRWLRDDRSVDSFEFILSGLGLTVFDSGAQSGASIVRLANRAGKLQPDLKAYLERRLYMVAPPQRIRRELSAEMANLMAAQTQSEVVERVFRAEIDSDALAALEEDMLVVRELMRQTSAVAAINFLEHVHSGVDLRRAQLVILSGGEKALALAQIDPEGVLDSAQTPIPWTNNLRLMLASLISVGIVLAWLTFNTLTRSIIRARPKRRSAIYAIEEPR